MPPSYGGREGTESVRYPQRQGPYLEAAEGHIDLAAALVGAVKHLQQAISIRHPPPLAAAPPAYKTARAHDTQHTSVYMHMLAHEPSLCLTGLVWEGKGQVKSLGSEWGVLMRQELQIPEDCTHRREV